MTFTPSVVPDSNCSLSHIIAFYYIPTFVGDEIVRAYFLRSDIIAPSRTDHLRVCHLTHVGRSSICEITSHHIGFRKKVDVPNNWDVQSWVETF